MRQFTIEYKIQTVKAVKAFGYGGQARASRDQGVSEASIGQWVKLYDKGLLKVGHSYSVSHNPKKLVGLELVMQQANAEREKLVTKMAELQAQAQQVTGELDALNTIIGAVNPREIVTTYVGADI
jgi:transposase-like protein